MKPKFWKSNSNNGGHPSSGQPAAISSASLESVAPLKLRGIAIEGHGPDMARDTFIEQHYFALRKTESASAKPRGDHSSVISRRNQGLKAERLAARTT